MQTLIDKKYIKINNYRMADNGREWAPVEILDAGFWHEWKSRKDDLKKQGLSVYKNQNGDFVAAHWRDYQKSSEKKSSDMALDPAGLLPYQIPHAEILLRSLCDNSAALDASDTGTGKTYVALACSRSLGIEPVIVCPKTAISTWRTVSSELGIKCTLISNYEQYKTDNTDSYNKDNGWAESVRLVIFDEAHKLKNRKTQNSELAKRAMEQGIPCLFLSATVAQDADDLAVIGKSLKIFSNHWRWKKSIGCWQDRWGGWSTPNAAVQKIHEQIFGKGRGARIDKKILAEFFGENIIRPELVDYNGAISAIYAQLEEEIESLRDAENHAACILTARLRARQRVELAKIQHIVEQTEQAVAEGYSVAIFVNFHESVDALARALKTDCVIDGRVKQEYREDRINNFQSNKENIIILNQATGGQSISLHDLGGRPRMSIINPSDNARDLLQCLGRIHRAGAKSAALQRIFFAADTIEADVCANIRRKIKNIETINDGDLSSQTENMIDELKIRRSKKTA